MNNKALSINVPLSKPADHVAVLSTPLEMEEFTCSFSGEAKLKSRKLRINYTVLCLIIHYKAKNIQLLPQIVNLLFDLIQ